MGQRVKRSYLFFFPTLFFLWSFDLDSLFILIICQSWLYRQIVIIISEMKIVFIKLAFLSSHLKLLPHHCSKEKEKHQNLIFSRNRRISTAYICYIFLTFWLPRQKKLLTFFLGYIVVFLSDSQHQLVLCTTASTTLPSPSLLSLLHVHLFTISLSV